MRQGNYVVVSYDGGLSFEMTASGGLWMAVSESGGGRMDIGGTVSVEWSISGRALAFNAGAYWIWQRQEPAKMGKWSSGFSVR